MADQPLMPLATAVWLIDNTSLTFDQIAEFCVLHPLQVKGIADGDVRRGRARDQPDHQPSVDARGNRESPKASGDYQCMKLSRPKTLVPEGEEKSAALYAGFQAPEPAGRPSPGLCAITRKSPTVRSASCSGRQRRPFVAIRDRSHWNSANLQPQDPVGPRSVHARSRLDAARAQGRPRKRLEIAPCRRAGRTQALRFSRLKRQRVAESSMSPRTRMTWILIRCSPIWAGAPR